MPRGGSMNGQHKEQEGGWLHSISSSTGMCPCSSEQMQPPESGSQCCWMKVTTEEMASVLWSGSFLDLSRPSYCIIALSSLGGSLLSNLHQHKAYTVSCAQLKVHFFQAYQNSPHPRSVL